MAFLLILSKLGDYLPVILARPRPQSLRSARAGIAPVGDSTVSNVADPTTRIASLLDVATREYASPKGMCWVAAVPTGHAGVQLKRCEVEDPSCGKVTDGCARLPFASFHGFGIVELTGRVRYQLLGFSFRFYSLDQAFMAFAADAGGVMIASPPVWAPRPSTQSGAACVWVAALVFLAPAAADLVTTLGDCLLLKQPWPASLAALRDWQHSGTEEARHSDDFRSVHWYGTDYTFTATQAACIKVLWRNWKNGTPDVGEDSILTDEEVDAEARRLIDVFRDRKAETRYHPCWNTMIVSRQKGAYRLNPQKGAYRLNPPEKA
jgi:hypothetical protein